MTDKLLRAPGALQPTSIDKVSPAERFALDSEAIRSAVREYERGGILPSPLMKSLGYTRHPMDCHHTRMKYTESAMRWRCADCGEWGIF